MRTNWRDQKEDVLRRYQEVGYVVLPGFLSVDEMDNLRINMARFIAEIVPSMPGKHVFYEDKSKPETLKQMQDLFRYDPYFEQMTFHSEFEALAEFLMQDKVVAQNLQYFNKPPGVGQPTPPHQDGYYFMLNPCDALTMWLALETVDEETGCVRYLPGSHLRGVRPHQRTTTLGFSQGISDYGESDQAVEVPIPAHPGDLLVHHAMTIHRANGNRSTTRTRQAMGFVYYGVNAREDKAAKAAYQEKLTREMTESGKI